MSIFRFYFALASILLLIANVAAVNLSGNEEPIQKSVYVAYGITPSAVVLGRGGAGVADASDGAYGHINPAGIFSTSADRIFLSHSNFWEDSRAECLNATLRYGELPVGVTLFYRKLGEAPVVVDASDYNDANTYSAYDAAITLSSGVKLNSIALGFSLKFMRSEIWHYSSSGIAADAGIACPLPVHGLSFGASVMNLGYATAYDRTAYPLNSIVRTGALYEKVLSNGLKLKFLSDIQTSIDGSLSVPVGVEAGNRWLNFRTGWNLLHDTQKFSAGFSMRFSSVQLDYAYVHFSENLSDNSKPQFFSISIVLD